MLMSVGLTGMFKVMTRNVRTEMGKMWDSYGTFPQNDMIVASNAPITCALASLRNRDKYVFLIVEYTLQ